MNIERIADCGHGARVGGVGANLNFWHSEAQADFGHDSVPREFLPSFIRFTRPISLISDYYSA